MKIRLGRESAEIESVKVPFGKKEKSQENSEKLAGTFLRLLFHLLPKANFGWRCEEKTKLGYTNNFRRIQLSKSI